MPDLPILPRSELEIARIVWNLKQATVRQVMDSLPPERSLDFFTVQTYLRRLTDKGYLVAKREGRTNVYHPKVKPDRVVKHAVRDFLKQLFDGKALPLMQHLLQEENLTNEQLDELQAHLDSLRNQEAD